MDFSIDFATIKLLDVAISPRARHLHGCPREDLRRRGQLPRRGDGPVPHFSAAPGAEGGPAGGFVDIDDALLEDVEEFEDAMGKKGGAVTFLNGCVDGIWRFP